KPLFTPGHVGSTHGALAAIEKSGQQPGDFLTRHVSGDWGEVPSEDIQENELSLQHGFRLLSAYHTSVSSRLFTDTTHNYKPFDIAQLLIYRRKRIWVQWAIFYSSSTIIVLTSWRFKKRYLAQGTAGSMLNGLGHSPRA